MVKNGAPAQGPRRGPVDSGNRAVPRVRVVLAVGHDFVRRAVAMLLAGSTVVELVGQTSTALGALDLLGREGAGVLVLDRRLPDEVSPASIRHMRLAAPGTSIVVVAMGEDAGWASEAIGAGASGYVLTDTADAELIDAVLAAAHGECYVSPRVLERLRAQVRSNPRELSESQSAVLCLIARGLSEGGVARDLGLSAAEVEACRADIHRQLGLASRAGLARYALRHGLLGGK
jgi:DNA-binding NarL/FixJ family response regulator